MCLDSKKIEKEVLQRNFKYKGFMPLGSWGLNVYASRKYYIETLNRLFRQDIKSSSIKKETGINASLYLVDCKLNSNIFNENRLIPDGHTVSLEYPQKGILTLFTGRFRIFLYKNRKPINIFVFVREPQYSLRGFNDHLLEIISKILFIFNRFYIHGGAVELHNKVSIFIGIRSSGKSTICLRLAKEGARIISEDHVLFKKQGNNFFISGCQKDAGVSKKTEKFIFDRSLKYRPRRYNGVLKKEFLLKDFFDCIPYQDFSFNSVFFVHRDNKFQLKKISQAEAVLKLIYMTKGFFRFNQVKDLDNYLKYFSQLAKKVKFFDLKLSADLKELDKLVEFLENGQA